ncbi:MAG: amidohydrolase family protein [Candidatus Buchananbacteria bacterium]|nr:amidohydrolase family protein [Candidatus Buchananbacteria bacterium]
MSQTIALLNGRVINPETSFDQVTNVLIKDGKIAEIGSPLKSAVSQDCNIIYCTDKLVCPGLIDVHVHFRTPGQEYKENLASGSLAALMGGFTSVVCMANTNPVIDNPEILHQVLCRAESGSFIDIYQVSSASLGLKGEELVDLEAMQQNGAIAISDDGKGIQNPDLLLEVMDWCQFHALPLLLHCEDSRFSPYDRRSEIHQASLILKLAEEFSLPVHLQHVSCKETVQLVSEAKNRKVLVTCEAAPHHFSLTNTDFKKIGANAKMNPPLRSETDRQAVISGLKDGTIDIIATDHAPHTNEEKSVSIKQAPFGVIGLETAVPVTFTTLQNHLSSAEIIAKLTLAPAKLLGFAQKGRLQVGLPADLVVIDPKKTKYVEKFQSKSVNCPWVGKRLKSWPVMTIHNGNIVMKDGSILV